MPSGLPSSPPSPWSTASRSPPIGSFTASSSPSRCKESSRGRLLRRLRPRHRPPRRRPPGTKSGDSVQPRRQRAPTSTRVSSPSGLVPSRAPSSSRCALVPPRCAADPIAGHRSLPLIRARPGLRPDRPRGRPARASARPARPAWAQLGPARGRWLRPQSRPCSPAWARLRPVSSGHTPACSPAWPAVRPACLPFGLFFL